MINNFVVYCKCTLAKLHVYMTAAQVEVHSHEVVLSVQLYAT